MAIRESKFIHPFIYIQITKHHAFTYTVDWYLCYHLQLNYGYYGYCVYIMYVWNHSIRDISHVIK